MHIMSNGFQIVSVFPISDDMAHRHLPAELWMMIIKKTQDDLGDSVAPLNAARTMAMTTPLFYVSTNNILFCILVPLNSVFE
jgi:hypothetical protein